jgi:phosphopantothenoylcysteine decarboxylase / phosphopantothenate---cysteine ligase
MKILLAVTGSISSYKTLDLTRELKKARHSIKIILTKGAEQFVVPQVYKYLGAEEVFHSQSDFENPNVLHVDLGNWCDLFVIAPLSANTLSRLCNAEASDILSSVFLALKKDVPILVFPAMNTQMLNHPFVQENFSKLNTLTQVFIHPTRSGKLVCNETGEGKLPDIELIHDFIESYPLSSQLVGEDILITTGATIAPLDPVRYLTNASSGITGFKLARYALSQRRKVKVIAGKFATKRLENLSANQNFEIVRVVTTSDMKEEVFKSLEKYPNYISSAAIGDFSFETSDQKMKKNLFSKSLSINSEEDILKSVIESKIPNKIIGFAAESELNESILNKKFLNKPVDLLVGTKVNNGLLNGSSVEGFSNSEAEYLILDSDKIFTKANLSKDELAQFIIDRV